MKFSFRAAAPLAAGFALLFTGTAMANGDRGGAVYTQSNSPTGNAVHRLDRGPDGLLTPVATYRTGGNGTGAPWSSSRRRTTGTTTGGTPTSSWPGGWRANGACCS